MINRIKNRLLFEWKKFKIFYSYHLSRALNWAYTFLRVNTKEESKQEKIKIAIGLFCKDENDYLEEWLNYHRGIGFNYFFIYDNGSKLPIAQSLSNARDCEVVLWEDDSVGKQLRAYCDCCKKHVDYNWILFIDTDEFLILKKDKTVQSFLNRFKFFKAVGLNWINYTSSGFDDRVPWNKYNKHLKLDNPENSHIKSFVVPKFINSVPLDPHKFSVLTVNENKKLIIGPKSPHTSEIAYIRHNITRSKNEYIEKIKRGRGDGVQTGHSMEFFDLLNRQSV